MSVTFWPWTWDELACRDLFATVIRRDMADAALNLLHLLSYEPEAGDPFKGGSARLARWGALRIAYRIDDQHHRLIPLAAGDEPDLTRVAVRRLRIRPQPGPRVPEQAVMFVAAKRLAGGLTLAVRTAWNDGHRPDEDGMMYLLDTRRAIVAWLPRERLVGVYASPADSGVLLSAAGTGPERNALYELVDRFGDR